jgi:hypothetical protein
MKREVLKTVGIIAASSVTGVAVVCAAAVAVLTFGPESLLHLGDCVYDADGQYRGMP